VCGFSEKEKMFGMRSEATQTLYRKPFPLSGSAPGPKGLSKGLLSGPLRDEFGFFSRHEEEALRKTGLRGVENARSKSRSVERVEKSNLEGTVDPIKVVPAYPDLIFVDRCPGCGSRGKFRRQWGKKPLQCAMCGRLYYDDDDGYELVEESGPKAMVGYVKLRSSMR